MSPSGQRRTVSQVLEEARARIERFAPAEALAATRDGAVLIDIRSDIDRERNGIVPGSLHIPRTVLEWRLDPDSDWRSPYAPGLDRQIILLCDHAFSSSLAAATLLDLGFSRVADVIGGFEAWRGARLPVGAAPPPRPGCDLAGLRPPDSVPEIDTDHWLQEHWDTSFNQHGIKGVSWYEPIPNTSLGLIDALDVGSDEAVIDVGGGAATLADSLIDRGFSDISVLDVSEAALGAVANRLGSDAPVTYLQGDVLEWKPNRAYDLWHDRAMFHFLVAEAERERYVETLQRAVRQGGAVIIGTFGNEGSDHCSGLSVQRYSSTELSGVLGPGFHVVQTAGSIHKTPTETVQPFTWIAARRLGG